MFDFTLRYIWQRPDWPQWRYELQRLVPLLSAIHREVGVLEGRMEEAGFETRRTSQLNALSDEVLKSNEIEGEQLDKASVRSSVARRLGMDAGALPVPDRYVDGVVAMILDATAHDMNPLLLSALCPGNRRSFRRAIVASSRLRLGNGGMTTRVRCKWSLAPSSAEKCILKRLRHPASCMKLNNF